MLQDPHKFKNHRLRWLFRPLRLVKFESLWIQVCSLVAVWGYRTVFPSLFFFFFEFWQSFLNDFYSNSLLLNALSLLVTASFIVHLRVFGIPLIPSICFLGCQSHCGASIIGGWPFPHFSLFSSFGISSSKASYWLSVLGVPRRLVFVLSFSKVSRFHFFSDPPFGYLPFCHFSQVSWFLFC